MTRSNTAVIVLASLTLPFISGCASLGGTAKSPPLAGESGLERIEIIVRGIE